MSFVRMHFWQVVARVNSSFTWPKNIGLKGTMPATVKSRLGSSGINDADGLIRWPFSLKKARKDSRSSKDFISFGFPSSWLGAFL